MLPGGCLNGLMTTKILSQNNRFFSGFETATSRMQNSNTTQYTELCRQSNKQTKIDDVDFEVLTAVIMKINLF
jgi:hypothetical protein